MGFEDKIAEQVFTTSKEKAFTDKVLTLNDVTLSREIQRKEKLSSEDVNDLMTLTSSTESKMLNFGLYDRYIQLKYYVWVREFCNLTLRLMNYIKKVRAGYHFKNNIIKNRQYLIKLNNKKVDWSQFKENLTITDNSKQLLYNCRSLIENSFKSLIDLYNNIGRSSLSVGAKAFDEMLKQKFEMVYTDPNKEQVKEQPKINIVKG